MKVKQQHIDAVNCVFHFLESHKEQATNRLFPEALESYKKEWLQRSPFQFWCHLDLSNQRELVTMAVEHYEEWS